MKLQGAVEARAPREAPVVWDGRLESGQLLALQLAARGYSMGQIGELTERPHSEVTALIEGAAARLGAGDAGAAVREAKRRALIV